MSTSHSFSLLLLPSALYHTVFDVVYPGLADLLARAGGIPQLSLILSTQMARLAIASLSYHTPPPGHTGPTGHTGFAQGYGQGGAGNGYWELVVECLCSSYSRTVSRMKDLPVEQELVKSATSVRLILYHQILFSSYTLYTHSFRLRHTHSVNLSLLLSLSLSIFHTRTFTHSQTHTHTHTCLNSSITLLLPYHSLPAAYLLVVSEEAPRHPQQTTHKTSLLLTKKLK
jgi:hypothetical protein